MEFAVLIANWNGSDCIERCLGSVVAAARRAGGIRIAVVDDASTDDSRDKISSRFPAADLFALPRNLGFGGAVNEGMRRLAELWVFLLNNDIVLPADFFERMIAARNSVDPARLFAIGARTVDWASGEPNHGGMLARWRDNMIVQEPFDAEELAPAHFVQAGACLISREKFWELGGFCGLYHPAYWEDYDLSYQALRRGWLNYYEPRAVAYHWGKRSMISRLGKESIAALVKRNHLLFNLVNLHDGALLRRHLLGLGGLALHAEDNGSDASWAKAFVEALPKFGEALRVRRHRTGTIAVSDREVLLSSRQG